MSTIERRLPYRLLSAFPDAISLLVMLQTWAHPLYFGPDGVVIGMALILLEIPALAALGCVFILFSDAVRIHVIRKLAVLIAVLVCICLLSEDMYRRAPSVALVVSIVSFLVGKFLVFVATRRESTWFFEGMKLTLHVAVFATLALLLRDAPVPRWGFTPEVMAQLPLGADSHPIDYLQRRTVWSAPWNLFACGTLYFLASATIRFFMSARERDVVLDDGVRHG